MDNPHFKNHDHTPLISNPLSLYRPFGHFSHLLFDICDLSRNNVPNASRSNAERNGKWTGDERLGKLFETGTLNGWTAN